jgi:Flp pilus assembly protein CpaB
VLVARQDLPAGTRITEPETVFRVRLYRLGEEPANAITDYSQLSGKTLNRPLASGEVCYVSDISVRVPEGLRAIAVRTSLADPVLTALKVGTRIDLSGQVVNDGTGRYQTLAEDVLVLAVNATSEAVQGQPSNPPGNNGAQNVTITVAVTPEQAQSLAAAQLQGGIGVTTRSKPEN